MNIIPYPKIFHLGHHMIEELFDDQVFVQEKIDGSQFSFCLTNEGERLFRSKGAIIYEDTADKLFLPAVESISTLMKEGRIPKGIIFRGEVVSKPRHNTLSYGRTPKHYVVIFDAQERDSQKFFSPVEVGNLCINAGLEYVGFLQTHIRNKTDFENQMSLPSMLGGKREGLVFKNYERVNRAGEILIGKFVSEEFKEVHRESWKNSNPGKQDFLELLIARFALPSRYKKSVQHFRESGKLTDSPKDIGPLIGEIQEDVKTEEEEYIKTLLFNHFWPQIKRGITRGFPEWYKNTLVNNQFNED